MVSIEEARNIASNLPEVEEKMHFETPDFRIRNKIFASLHRDKKLMMVKLSSIDQSVFCSYNKEIIYPVPGGWGLKGATFVDLNKIKKPMLRDAITTAWKNVAPVSLIKKYFPE